MSEKPQGSGESTLTVVLALLVNLAIAVMKAIAGVLTGSAAILSEAAHSVADTFTEALLLTALRRSDRPADRRHPFGYGKERYFWSLLAAVSIRALKVENPTLASLAQNGISPQRIVRAVSTFSSSSAITQPCCVGARL